MNQKRIHVVAAVIERGNQILIAKRPSHLHQGGLWEFPGGKVEAGESALNALKRELFEELDIHLSHAEPLIKIDHNYNDKLIQLDVWRAAKFNGEARGKEKQDICWVSANELNEIEFPAANRSIVTAAQLPQQYLITPDPFYENEQQFLTQLENAFKRGITLAQLRSKKLPLNKLSALYKRASKIATQYNATLMLNCSIEEANSIGVAHVHLSSKNLLTLTSPPSTRLCAASCHNREEVEKASTLGIDFIVIAPVNKTKTHLEAPVIGWDKFNALCGVSAVPVFALGGMKESDRLTAINNGAQGIAAISALWL